MLKLIQRVPLIKKLESLNDILQETEELIKIFVTSIKTAEKKPEIDMVEFSLFGICFFIQMLDVRCSMFDVHLFKTSPDGINATCEHLQNNLALMASPPNGWRGS